MSPTSKVLERTIAKFRTGRAVANTALQTERKLQGVKSKHPFTLKSPVLCSKTIWFVLGFFHLLLQTKSLWCTAC